MPVRVNIYLCGDCFISRVMNWFTYLLERRFKMPLITRRGANSKWIYVAFWKHGPLTALLLNWWSNRSEFNVHKVIIITINLFLNGPHDRYMWGPCALFKLTIPAVYYILNTGLFFRSDWSYILGKKGIIWFCLVRGRR